MAPKGGAGAGAGAGAVPALARPLPRGKGEVSLSAMAFLLGETVRYSQDRVRSSEETAARVSAAGFAVGARYLELAVYRGHHGKRETKYMEFFKFVAGPLWKSLFGKQADSLEKAVDRDDEYRIIEDEPLPLCKFFSTSTTTNSAPHGVAFVAGILEGVLDAAQFPATVKGVCTPEEGRPLPRTVFIIRFEPEVIEERA